jgi:outer membrane receptor protein involved in Fe transport
MLGTLFMGVSVARVNPQKSNPPAQDSQKQPSNERDDSTLRYGGAFFADKNPKTALDMVSLLPGFTFSAGDTSLRGYSAAAGNVLVDGARPSDKQFSLNDVLSHVPADEVDYIEVIRGDKPGLDLLGQTVVANVVRKKGAGNSKIVTLSDGQFIDGRNTPSVTVEATRHLSGGRSFSGAISLSRYVELAEGGGSQVRQDADGNVLQRLAVDSHAGGLTGYTYGVFSAPLWNGRFALNGSLARTDYTYYEMDLVTFPSASSSQLDECLGGPLGGQLKGELGAHFNRMFGAKWNSESIVLLDLKGQSYSSQLAGSGMVQLFAAHERSGEALARFNLRYAATRDLTAQFSVEGAFNRLYTTNSFTFDGVPILLPNARAMVSETRQQASAQATWVVARPLQLEMGVAIEHSLIASRADVRKDTALTYPKPRFVVTFTPNAAGQFRIRIEREVGQLDFNSFVASSSLDTGSVRAGNTNIVPQQDWALEASYEQHFWSGGDISLTYRRLLISDAIDRVPIYSPSGGVFDGPGNIGAGSEDVVIAGLTIPLDRLGIAHAQLKATGTFQRSRVTDPTTGLERAVTDLNPTEYAVNFRQDLPQWRVDWGAGLRTPCVSSGTVKGCTKSQYRFNEVDTYYAQPALAFFVEYSPEAHTTLRVEVDNVLQQRYDRVVQSYAGPRNLVPLSYADDRRLKSSASFLISVRRAF